MRIKHFYYCVFYLLHIKALGKQSSMEAGQQSRSMRSMSISSTKTKLTPSYGWVSSWWFRQVHYSREKSYNGSSTSNSKHKNLTCNYCHKKGHIRADCWLRKKKQPDANIIELIGEDEDEGDVLFVIDKLVCNKDRWVLDFGCSQHISSNRKTFSSYTSVQRGEVFMGNSSTSKVIGEGTIQFRSHDKYIITLQGVRHVPESRSHLSWSPI